MPTSYPSSSRSCRTRGRDRLDILIELSAWALIMPLLALFWWPLLSYIWHYWFG